MKLTAKSNEIFEYVKNNGGRVSVDELAEATGRTTKSVNANVTDLAKKGLCAREKVAATSEDEKDMTFVVITEDGKAFVPSDDEE